jgi:Reverse transcriptase (RNA-dependent DNA polymerase)
MSEAYEQIRMDLAHVSKTAFATILGTFRIQVMQMGDCNAPSMFQRLMMAIFHNCIGRLVHVYMDNIFSCSIEEHERHLGIVFDRLCKNHLFLNKKKVDLYTEKMECLGHIIADRGIHADTDKMQLDENGGFQECITMSKDSSDSCSTWHITCQMSAHTQPL